MAGALAWGLVLVFITGIANAGIIGSPGKACALESLRALECLPAEGQGKRPSRQASGAVQVRKES
ncbi:hypothetical protein A5904_14360 (plasmid) [Acidithiobacillus caldus]|nr:hypothetical protein A5904_14360 [Acidithiobacillus caldus]